MKLIDADRLRKAVDEAVGRLGLEGKMVMGVAEYLAEKEGISLVLCGNCEYFPRAKTNKKGFLICPATGMEVFEDDYCSHGDRGDGNETD